MKGLAIDTSNLVMGVAVMDDDKVIGEYITNLKKNHSVRIMPAIDALMEEVELEPRDLDRIIVANGPGSYTGVRIGVSVAKTMAWTLNLPLVGVSSLEVLAQNGYYFPGEVVPFFDARRGQVYTGLYGKENSSFQSLMEERITLASDWAEALAERDGDYLILGNDMAQHAQTFVDALGDRVTLASSSMLNPRPGELARLGMQRQPAEDIHTFVPNYIRLAEAEAKWLKAQKSE